MRSLLTPLIGWTKEIGFLGLYVLAGITGSFIRLDSINKNPIKDTPIVFVHGWLTQNPVYYLLKRFLEKEGFRVYMTNFGLQTGDFHDMAKLLKEYIEERRLDKFTLVGASGGAIISFLYLQKLGGWQYVNKFISIGGPFKGSPLAFLACFSKAARQMIPNSQFQEELAINKIKKPKKVVCISTRHDELVPIWSSQLPDTHNIVVDIIGHVNLQAFSKAVFQIILRHA